VNEAACEVSAPPLGDYRSALSPPPPPCPRSAKARRQACHCLETDGTVRNRNADRNSPTDYMLPLDVNAEEVRKAIEAMRLPKRTCSRYSRAGPPPKAWISSTIVQRKRRR
jgi:hypothetical protein